MCELLNAQCLAESKHLNVAFIIIDWSWETFSVKGQIVNILDFEDHTVSVTVIHLCLHIGNMLTDVCSYVLVKLFI